ncbi:MAG: hypothetical protein HY901_00020, partial [Deltaproteobacteria bacterium]|nr:hypothetical protein [Deltaproteobacteria bacterium]
MYRSVLSSLLVALLPAAAAAESAVPMPAVPAEEQAAFDPAARYLREQSYTRSCDAFGAFLKNFPSGALVREAKVKRAIACAQSGGETSEVLRDLQAIAGDGPLDYPRALANARLVDRGDRWMPKGGERTKLALDQLAAIAERSGGRWAQEARARFMALCFAEMERGYGQVEQLVDRVLSASPTSAEKDHALYVRGRSGLHNETTHKRSEKDLLAVGQGSSEWADDALYDLGNWREGKSEFEKALELYGEVVRRFDSSTSNRRSSAQSQIESIKRPSLSISSPYTELPGDKTRLQLSFRNLTETRLVLHKADPFHAEAQKMVSGHAVDRAGARGQQLKSWSESLKAPSPYAPGSKEIAIDLSAGSYVLEATSAGQSSSTTILVSPLASVLKVGGGRAAVWTVDALSGQAIAQAEVALYVRQDNQSTSYRRLEGRSDATGLCLFDLGPGAVGSAVAWSGKGDAWTMTTGYGNWRDTGSGEFLAYVLTDRPLYKPAETVGLKIFVRVR